MKLVIQRVTCSNLYIDGSLISQIKQGLVVLIGISKSDSENVIDKLVKKLLNLRVFEDENSKMNYSILDIEEEKPFNKSNLEAGCCSYRSNEIDGLPCHI